MALPMDVDDRMSLPTIDLGRHVDVAAVDDIPAGEDGRYMIDSQAVAVFHEGGAFYAVSDTCTHEEYSIDLMPGDSR